MASSDSLRYRSQRASSAVAKEYIPLKDGHTVEKQVRPQTGTFSDGPLACKPVTTTGLHLSRVVFDNGQFLFCETGKRCLNWKTSSGRRMEESSAGRGTRWHIFWGRHQNLNKIHANIS